MQKLLLLSVILASNYLVAFAQKDTTLRIDIEPVTITAQKINTDIKYILSGASVVDVQQIGIAKQQLSINEYLSEVPGLFSLNSNNYSQDLRVSIRGFGARSAFGIRGVKILVDGIPLTTPDGQGQVDNIDIGLLEKIEVLRTPSSALYGNASGGIINIKSRDNVERNYFQLNSNFGSFGSSKNQLEGGLKLDKTQLLFNLSHTQTDGYRDHSSMKQNQGSVNAMHSLNDSSKIKIRVNYFDSPLAQDPGGLKKEDFSEDRQVARDQNVLFDAGEAVRQFEISGIHDQALRNNGNITNRLFYTNRKFAANLPFEDGGIVQFDRDFAGIGSNFTKTTQSGNLENTLLAGYDILLQRDDRTRFVNNEGETGDLVFHQIESFSNASVFISDHLQINKKSFINLNLRYDWNRVNAKDLILTDGDNSGSKNFDDLNIGFGFGYKISRKFFPFVNLHTSFETPTLNELSSNPENTEGFNLSLDPQSSVNIDLGLRGNITDYLRYDIVAFRIKTKSEIVPYQPDQFPERTFYRNAGKTSRWGIETSLDYTAYQSLRIKMSYAYSDFTFEEYVIDQNSFDGNYLPGIPKYKASLSIRYHFDWGLDLGLLNNYVSEIFLSDGNQSADDPYMVSNFTTSFDKTFNRFTISPYLGINNIFNELYHDNIRINAFGGRYFEAAPTRHFYVGVRIRWE